MQDAFERIDLITLKKTSLLTSFKNLVIVWECKLEKSWTPFHLSAKIVVAFELNGGNGCEYFVVLIKTIIFKYICYRHNRLFLLPCINKKKKVPDGIINVILWFHNKMLVNSTMP